MEKQYPQKLCELGRVTRSCPIVIEDSWLVSCQGYEVYQQGQKQQQPPPSHMTDLLLQTV
jgi:hypothetical protein